MSVGRAVRTRLGRFEAPVSDFYRSRFIDLDACARLLAETVEADSILEVGCGDGQMARTAELRGLIPGLFPDDPEVLAAQIGPRRNNLLLAYRRT